MLYKYCPNCASLRISSTNGGKEYTCSTCSYQGEIKEDTIDVINKQKQNLVNKNIETTTNPLKEKIEEKPDMKDKIKKISEKTSDDWELL